MHHSSYRDPLDGPPPKWEKRKAVPSEVQDSAWSWGHTGIKPPSDKVIQQTSSPSPSKTPKHGSVSPVVRKKVAELASSQSPASPPQETQNVDRSTITGSEEFIANQLLLLSDINELFTACSDPSGTKFQALSAPVIQRLNQFIQGETINLEHVLFLLRKTLKITIP